MDNRRLLLAIFLSWAVVIVWSFLFSPKPAPPADPETVPFSESQEADPTPTSSTSTSAESSSGDVPGAAVPEEATLEAEPPAEATSEETFRLESAAFVAEITNRGAQLRSFRLHDYLDEDGAPLDLVRRRTDDGILPFGLMGEGDTELLNEALFVGEWEERGKTLVLRYVGDRGRATKRFEVRKDGFIDIEVEVRSDADWALFVGPGVENPTENELSQPQFWRGVTYRQADDKEKVNAAKLSEDEILPGRGLDWVVLDDSYFLTAIIPRSGLAEIALRPFLFAATDEGSELTSFPEDGKLSAEQKEMAREIGMLLYPRGQSLELTSYLGAKEYGLLQGLPYGLEQTVDLGWFSFLARPLQIGLNWIYNNVINNYGWAIVLMTILIKLILLPLTHQSMMSSQKMQLLNPKVQGIRAKYKGKLKDKQGKPNLEMQRKMQDEIMGTYRSEGVNPASGCIPVVFQIPVFFAFYQLLGTAIELRQAEWIYWVVDLSARDPYYVLPIVMFATQFIQQLRMPMGADPMQRRLFLMMPFIFLFIFLRFPSGLVLYWLTNNVFTIFQQEVYKAMKAKKENGSGEAKTKAKEGGSKKKESGGRSKGKK